MGEKTPIHDPYARGTLVGLGLHHTLGHVWRAALEAVVFGFRHHIEVFEELGYAVRRVIASDGGASSRVWMQIAADALGRPIELLQGHPGSCLGAAYVAAVGVGALDDWDAITRFVRPAGVVEPDPSSRGCLPPCLRALSRHLPAPAVALSRPPGASRLTRKEF